MSTENLLSGSHIAEIAIGAATQPCIVLVEFHARTDLRWARSTLTTNGSADSVSLTVISFADVAGGTATATVVRTCPPNAEGIADVVRSAEAASREADAADDAAPLAADTAMSSFDEPGEAVGSVSAVATALGDILNRGRAEGIEHFGYAEASMSTVWLASTTGLRLRHVLPAARLELCAKSHNRTRSSWAGTAATTFDDVDLLPLDLQTRQGLAWQATTIDVDPGRHRAILSPSATADLLIEVWWNAVAREATDGRSVFSRAGGGTRISDRLTQRNVLLASDPYAPGLETSPFATAAMSHGAASVFDNGIPVNRHEWISGGVLNALMTPRGLTAETGVPAAISADNVIVDAAGHGSLDDLIARTESGLLVTCVWYNRIVDPQSLLLTGLTRDGVYVVKNGEVVGATRNFRFNESPVSMLNRIQDASVRARTLPREMGDYVARVEAPAMVVDGFNFSTASDAL